MTRAQRARVYRPTPRNLAFLAGRLQRGELVAVPTETVYGLAANAFDEVACRRIFRAKGRPSQDPLIVHIHRSSQLEELCFPNAAARLLAEQFWPGPLTLVLPKRPCVPSIVTAGRDSVAVRMPRHPVFRRLLTRTGLPLAAPSANPFGYISPTTAEHVVTSLGRRILHVMDGGAAQIGIESTIVDLRDEQRPTLLRPGAITAEQIAAVIGRAVENRSRRSTSQQEAQIAPGLLKRHYSPRTPVVLHDKLPAEVPPDEALVYLTKPSGKLGAHVSWLDRRGDLRGVARSLFSTLRRLDQGNFKAIHIERPRGGGLAIAINDRLQRAAAR
jgi:L-threonylcarbamoyladenylate synthase